MTAKSCRINAESIRWLGFQLADLLGKYYLGVISFVVTMLVFTQFLGVGISFDKSIPEDTLYIVKKWDRTPEYGGKFAIRTEKGPLGPPAGLMLVKYVYGMPGDVVTTGGPDGRQVFLNGQKLSYAKRFTRDGKPLTVTHGGTIPPGYVYVGTPSKDSYDSRYATVGFVSNERIVGRVITLF